MTRREFCNRLEEECKRNLACNPGCRFYKELYDGINTCAIRDVTEHSLLNEFESDALATSTLESFEKITPNITINAENVYICERKNDG